MNAKTLIKYLCGNEEAIKQIAHSPQAIWVGLLFVLSAGFAREYDQEDLLHDPWYLLIPLVASVASSILLYLVVRLFYWFSVKENHGVPPGYRLFLSLFWMTAPLAWVYAIPVERFLSAGDAVRVNLYLLGIVSLWRVLLITHVISVLWRASYFWTLFIVMLFAEGVVFGIINFTTLPVINIMGGINQTDGESLVAATVISVTIWSILSFPVWLIGAAIGSHRYLVRRRKEALPPIETSEKTAVHNSLWMFCIASLMIWAFILPYTQPEQNLKRQVNSLFRSGELETAISIMSENRLDDFPPHWDPPPHFGYGEYEPGLAQIMDSIITSDAAPWVLDFHIQKLKYYLPENKYGWRSVEFGFDEISKKQLETLVEFLESNPERGKELSQLFQAEIEYTKEDFAEDPNKTVPFLKWIKLTDRILALVPAPDDEAGTQ